MKPIISLLILLCFSCSSVSYKQGSDGTVTASRIDLGRDVTDERFSVASLGLEYSVGQQNESDSLMSLIRTAGTTISALAAAELEKVRNSNDSKTAQKAIKGGTATSLSRERTARTAITEETKRKSIEILPSLQ